MADSLSHSCPTCALRLNPERVAMRSLWDEFPTEAMVEIELETGGWPRVLVGGIAASGYYHIKLIGCDNSLRQVGRHERQETQ